MNSLNRKDDDFYRRFVRYWEEVTEVPPQNLGVLTPYYKILASGVKDHPWPAIMFIGFLTAGAVYAILGPAVVAVVSVLQRGI